MKKTLIALFATASVFAGVSAASAEDKSLTNNLTVRATLTNGCNINFDAGKNVFDFGLVNDLSDKKFEDSQFIIKCTNSLKNPDGSADTNTYAPTSVALNAGSGLGSTVDNRTLSNGKDTLQFQVYKEHGNNVVWGDKPGAASESGTVYLTPNQNETYPFRVALLKQEIAGKTVGRYENIMVATVNYTADATK